MSTTSTATPTPYLVLVAVLVFGLVLFIVLTCKRNEQFTAPGLTLTKPPSWFPQNAAKPYNKKDWETKMYLDRYPFHVFNGKDFEFMSPEATDAMASVYKGWRI